MGRGATGERRLRGPVVHRIKRWALACVLLVAVFCGAGTAPAEAKRGLATGFGALWSTGEQGLDEVLAGGAKIVRLGPSWAKIAPTEPENPRDPADPAYDFSELDEAIRNIRARGLSVLLTIGWAPAWAEGEGRPPVGPNAPAGTWRPRPEPARDFGEALARRYSGSFPDPENPEVTLPRVRHFQIFNEPNLSTYITPQWQGGRPVSASIYRQLLNAFYDGIKAVDESNVVVTAGTGPYGDDAGGSRVRPLRFWRAVLCLRANLKRANCPTRPRFDVLAHHPINTSGGPFRGALHPDDASSPDMWKLRRVLRAAERRGTVATKGRHPLWVTEFWWDRHTLGPRLISLRKQARWMAEGLYLFWRGGASVALNHTVRDAAKPEGRATTAGVYLHDGTPKPALRAFRFPFVAIERGRARKRGGRRVVELWGKAPAGARVSIYQRRGRGWRLLKRVRTGRGGVFQKRLRMRGRPRLQARAANGERSLPYRVR
jgi:hypothetical protein